MDNILYALDSTTISTSIKLATWALGKYGKGAVKMHTMLDLRGSIPASIHITHGRWHDSNEQDVIAPEPRASENAVRIHLWVAVIAYLIIAKIKVDYKSPYSITEVATTIRVYALEKASLGELINKPKLTGNFNQSLKELTLFDNG